MEPVVKATLALLQSELLQGGAYTHAHSFTHSFTPPPTHSLTQSTEPVVKATLSLLQSALLQGGALRAVLDLFTLLSKARGDAEYVVGSMVSRALFLLSFRLFYGAMEI